jgi:hypothetical protein
MTDLKLVRPKLWRPPSLRPRTVASFRPTLIANLYLWLDASDLSTITDAGAGAVSQWNDKSGAGNNATQGTAANRPTTGTRSQNGKNVIDFDAVNDEMGSAATAANSPVTCFVVCMPDRQGHASGTQPVKCTGSGLMIGEFNDTSAKWGWGRSGIAWDQSYDAGVAFAASTAYVLMSAFDTATNSIMKVNGGAEETDADADRFAGGGTTNIGTNVSWDGWIGEVLKYNALLSAADRARVFAYLRQKWGI